jgi:hypothetical protein
MSRKERTAGASKVKTLIALIVLILAGLPTAESAMNEQLRVVEDLRRELIVLPPSAPERSRLEVLESVMFVEKGGSAGVLIYYDDIRTKWDIDYIEIYDVEGRLLLVSWLDRFGVCQVAMDRGLLDADDPTLEGVFVMIATGMAL